MAQGDYASKDRRRIRTSNPLERIMKEIRRCAPTWWGLSLMETPL